jgi:2-methylcitrate dehydratase PrpD
MIYEYSLREVLIIDPDLKGVAPHVSTLLPDARRSAAGTVAAAVTAAGLAEVLSGIAASPLSDPAGTATIQRLLHALGVGLMSTRLDPYAASMRALSGERGESTVLASRETLSDGGAAFVNAVAMHSSLQEDCGPGGYHGGSHPGVYIIPAALAAAESIGASGERLLRGVAVGYEAAHRVGASVPPGLVARKFRPVGVIGPFGAAAAAASILGDGASVIRRAIGFAANLSAGTSQGFVPGTMEPYFHAGFSARNGLLAAKLAVAGAPAAENALEGPHGFFAVYAGEPGLYEALSAPQERLAVERLGSKKYAACLQNQESLELATELGRRLGGSRIRSAVLERPDTSANGTASPGVGAEPPYVTMLQRQMSARYTVAAALLGRNVRAPMYFQKDDTEVARLAGQIELRMAAGDEIALTADLGGKRVSIRGRRESILFPTPQETAELFLTRAGLVLGTGGAASARQKIDSLPGLANVRELTGALRT